MKGNFAELAHRQQSREASERHCMGYRIRQGEIGKDRHAIEQKLKCPSIVLDLVLAMQLVIPHFDLYNP